MSRVRTTEPPPADPTPLDHELATAVADEQPLAQHVGQLEHDLAEAVADSNYDRAAELQADLETARQAAHIAAGRVAGLRAGLARLAEQRAADQAKIDQQRAREQAEQARGAAEQARAAALTEAEQHYAEATAGYDAIRAAFSRGVAAENRAHAALLDIDRCDEQLTGRPAPRRGGCSAGANLRNKDEVWFQLLQGM